MRSRHRWHWGALIALFTLWSFVGRAAAAAVWGDVNCDGMLTASDWSALITALFADSTCQSADVNRDGQLSAADLPLESQLFVAGHVPTAVPTFSRSRTTTPTRTPMWTAIATFTLITAGTPTPTASATPVPQATAPTGSDGSGAFVATTATADAFGGTVSPYAWMVTRGDYVTCDFDTVIDRPAGVGTPTPGVTPKWDFRAEYATLPASQNCDDVTNWNSVPLGSIVDPNKRLSVRHVPLPMTAPPICFRGRQSHVGTSLGHAAGTAVFHCYDASGEGNIHFQGTGGAESVTTDFYGGNLLRGVNTDRTYWLNPGVRLASCSGAVALPSTAGSGATWQIDLRYSTAALGSSQNSLDLSYTTVRNVCQISGTNKSCVWTPVAVNVPDGGTMQIHGSCVAGSCMSFSAGVNYALDCSSSSTPPYNAGGASNGTAGSGAFNANHSFDVGGWGISDRRWLNAGPAPDISQEFWIAPPAGLKACAGAFTFANPINGRGNYDIGLTVSKTVPTSAQSCVDLSYTTTGSLTSLPAGSKSAVFPLTTVAIPGGACFALNVATSGGTPSATSNPFNWQAYCVANGR